MLQQKQGHWDSLHLMHQCLTRLLTVYFSFSCSNTSYVTVTGFPQGHSWNGVSLHHCNWLIGDLFLYCSDDGMAFCFSARRATMATRMVDMIMELRALCHVDQSHSQSCAKNANSHYRALTQHWYLDIPLHFASGKLWVMQQLPFFGVVYQESRIPCCN